MLWLIGLGFVACTAGIAVVFVRSQRARKPTHTIVAAPEGEPLRIAGIVHADAQLAAIVTGRPCVYCRVELRVWSEGKVLAHLASSHVDFFVDDGTGRAQILAERATFEVVADIVEMGRASQLTPAARALVARYSWPLPDVARVELCEAILAKAARVEVSGAATREPDVAAPSSDVERGYREGAGTVLVFASDHVVRGEPRERSFIGERYPTTPPT